MKPIPSTLARRVLLYSTCAAAALTVSVASAKEEAGKFLDRLQRHGYGEAGIFYLNQLQKEGELPAELKETLDLELSKCFSIAVVEAYNADAAKNCLAKSQEHLKKFLEEHSGHPRRAEALATAGDLKSNHALDEMRLARLTKDKDERAEHLAEARKSLVEAGPKYTEAAESIGQQFKTAKEALNRRRGPGANNKAKDEADRLQLDWLETRVKVAMVDYYVAQTYPAPDATAAKDDPADKPRKDAYAKAAKALDEIHQENRTLTVGVYALMWQGKCVDELGDLATADEIYNEVLAFGPDEPGEKPTGMEQMLAQANQFHLNLVRRRDGIKEYFKKADQWVKQWEGPGPGSRTKDTVLAQAWRKTDGYQGACLDLCRAYVSESEKLSGEEKAKLRAKAVKVLQLMVKVSSEYTAEAMQLLKQLGGGNGDVAGPRVEPKDFTDANTLGDAALTGGDVNDALYYFERAQAFAEKFPAKYKKELPALAKKLAKARLQVAYALFYGKEKKNAEALKMAEDLCHDRTASEIAPKAAALAADITFRMYVAAIRGPKDEADAALAQFNKLADYAVKQYPGDAETDGVRIHLGHVSVANGDWKKAIQAFDMVNPLSASRGEALHWTGVAHWKSYLEEKSKPEGKRDEKLLAAEQAAALDSLRQSLAKQQANVDKTKEELPRELFETRLLLCELLNDVGQNKEAAELVAPLVAKIKAQSPEDRSGDQLTTLRTCIAAMKAYMGAKQTDKAAEVVKLLTDSGADVPQANQELCKFAGLVDVVVKEASAEVINLQTANKLNELDAAKTKLADNQKLLADLLQKLAERKQNSLGNMMFIADTCGRISLPEAAESQYNRILDEKKDDPKFPQAEMRVRSQLAGLLRLKAAGLVAENKTDEAKATFKSALDQVDAMIKAKKNALEPKMERGRILQDWSAIDPAKFPEAEKHWTALRLQMQGMKHKPPEYYEVVYFAAECLFTESQKLADKVLAADKLKQAEQLLNASLVLAPKLNGADTVARYKALLNKVKIARGGGIAPANPAGAQPVAKNK